MVANLPRKATRLANVFFVLGITLLILVFVTEGGYLLLSVFGALVAVVTAFTFAILAARRNRSPHLNSEERLTRNKLVWQMTVATILLIASTGILFRTLKWARDLSVTSVSTANLRSIAIALDMYRERYHSTPTTFSDLLITDVISRKTLISPFDNRYEQLNATGGTSYVYRPPEMTLPDEAVAVISYEEQPWCPLGFRFFPEHAHAVLFADGRVEFLRPAELAMALAVKPRVPAQVIAAYQKTEKCEYLEWLATYYLKVGMSLLVIESSLMPTVECNVGDPKTCRMLMCERDGPWGTYLILHLSESQHLKDWEWVSE